MLENIQHGQTASDLNQVRAYLQSIINYRVTDLATHFNKNQIKNIVEAYSIDRPNDYKDIALDELSDLDGDDLNTLITRPNNMPHTAQIFAEKITFRIFNAIESIIREIESELRIERKYGEAA